MKSSKKWSQCGEHRVWVGVGNPRLRSPHRHAPEMATGERQSLIVPRRNSDNPKFHPEDTRRFLGTTGSAVRHMFPSRSYWERVLILG